MRHVKHEEFTKCNVNETVGRHKTEMGRIFSTRIVFSGREKVISAEDGERGSFSPGRNLLKLCYYLPFILRVFFHLPSLGNEGSGRMKRWNTVAKPHRQVYREFTAITTEEQ